MLTKKILKAIKQSFNNSMIYNKMNYEEIRFIINVIYGTGKQKNIVEIIKKYFIPKIMILYLQIKKVMQVCYVNLQLMRM